VKASSVQIFSKMYDRIYLCLLLSQGIKPSSSAEGRDAIFPMTTPAGEERQSKEEKLLLDHLDLAVVSSG
jgi:hypothetical protein